MDDAEIEKLRGWIDDLKLQRDAYQLMEDGIKKLEEYNVLAAKINAKMDGKEKIWRWLEIHPVFFKENSAPDVRTSGIYTEDIKRLTAKIIELNSELVMKIRKNRKK